MKNNEGITEQLKADNQLEWVRLMNNIRHRATEIVNNDSYTPNPKPRPTRSRFFQYGIEETH